MALHVRARFGGGGFEPGFNPGSNSRPSGGGAGGGGGGNNNIENFFRVEIGLRVHRLGVWDRSPYC